MQQKKSINLGFRGWMLVLYQAIAFMTYQVFTNYPLNILSDLYGGSSTVSIIYTVGAVLGIIIQLVFANKINKVKNVKVMSSIVGAAALIVSFLVMVVPAGIGWYIVYGLANIFTVIYATFSIGVLVGQWFPTRKGTVMGIATFAFPISNGLIGAFASAAFKNGVPNVFNSFLPFFIVAVVGWLIGLIFIKDYPEQCGAYRDNDRSLTPEIANKMLEAEIENKRTTVWKLGKTLSTGDYWLLTIPLGLLLMFSVGMMTQTSAMIGTYENLNYQIIMVIIMIFGLLGSYFLGLLDTKIGTKKAVTIAMILMVVSGILGAIPNEITLVVALVLLALFMGASSNFTVSASVQYWRIEDYPSVFAVVNPIANILCSIGPMLIANLMYTTLGYRAPFIACAVAGVIGAVFIILFKPARVAKKDNALRAAAGKPVDDALASRK